MSINLVRNYLFQPQNIINTNTPEHVLFFLVESCGKKISVEDLRQKKDKIIQFLLNYKYTFDFENLQTKDLNQFSYFVSTTKYRWSKKQLLDSVKNIINFKVSEDINLEKISPDNVDGSDISMLYAFCVEKDIDMDINDDFDILKTKILDYLISKKNKEDIIDNILIKLNRINKKDLFQISNKITKLKEYKQEIIEERNFDTSYLMSKSCLNDKAAVGYGIKIYATDLSESLNPLKDLHLLSRCKMNGEEFLPYDSDSDFYQKYKKNKLFYNINKYWKSNFSSLYNNKNKAEIQKYEACDFSLLDQRYREKSFYDLGDETITYSVLNEQENKLIFEDMIDIFQKNNYFKEPNSEEIIEYNIVSKLLNIAEDNNNENLKNEILRVRKLSVDNYPATKKLLENYILKSESVNKILREIQYYCFVLRGWKKEKPYPLKKENVSFDIDKLEIDESYKKIQELQKDLVYSGINDILCVKYEDSENIKYTKFKLLDIIKTENINQNIDYTTIILFSCYYYNKLCSNKIIFDIEELEYIN